MSRVLVTTEADLTWGFDDGPPKLPYGSANGRGYKQWETVDPHPAYAHDERLVRKALRDVESCASIRFKPTVTIFCREPLGRTNGWGRNEGEEKEWEGLIGLAAKRIPLHPAMTRYLVGHEYGHHADYEICRRRDLDGETETIDAEYAALRKLPDGWDRYGPGYWHSNVGEFIANDFRILVAGLEPEFWPHPGYARPERVKGLAAWWREALS